MMYDAAKLNTPAPLHVSPGMIAPASSVFKYHIMLCLLPVDILPFLRVRKDKAEIDITF